MELTSRKEKILSHVVAGYIKSGEPVGSKAIADEVGASSATVRNEMAELIDMGLLEQPHISAGRIPSQRGYREYVDRLMEVPALSDKDKRYLESALTANAYAPDSLLMCAARLLASASRCVGIVTTPSGAAATIRAVQFVQTSRRSAMLILMTSAGTMKTRVFRCDFDLTNEIMRVYFRIFNERVAGRNVSEITPAFLQSVAASLGQLYALAVPALKTLFEVAQDTASTQVLLDGQMNLLFYPELENGIARRVMDFLERKEELIRLLQQKPGRVITLIGRESKKPELEEISLLISRYSIGGQDVGSLCIAGPVRMDYAHMTALIEYLREQVGKMLTVLMREE